MERHIKIVGILYIALGVFGVLVAMVLLFVVGEGGPMMGDRYSVEATKIVMAIVIGALLLFSVLGIIGGIGLLQRRSWARPLVIILAALNLFNFPLGTAVGIYALWAMLKPETQALLSAPGSGAWAH
ncbi:MAG: hypothetical protein JMDDDDMK_00572 [Acidobacteria bacterium]|nr:hypothetical protein [Acidobacteriota bacterium]